MHKKPYCKVPIITFLSILKGQRNIKYLALFTVKFVYGQLTQNNALKCHINISRL